MNLVVFELLTFWMSNVKIALRTRFESIHQKEQKEMFQWITSVAVPIISKSCEQSNFCIAHLKFLQFDNYRFEFDKYGIKWKSDTLSLRWHIEIHRTMFIRFDIAGGIWVPLFSKHYNKNYSKGPWNIACDNHSNSLPWFYTISGRLCICDRNGCLHDMYPAPAHPANESWCKDFLFGTIT